MTKYLLIGGNGVIGHFVTRRLVEQGHRPVVLSRNANADLLADVLDRCEIVRGDVTDAADLREMVGVNGITHLVHLGAALPSVAENDPALAARINIEGVANVLDAARRNGVSRVVLASSKAVYGEADGEYGPPDYRPISENMPPKPTAVYGITKLGGELLGRWFRKQHGLSVVALRFGATIGPGKIGRHGGGFGRFSAILENSMAGVATRVDNDGKAPCDCLFNDEVARGIVSALQAGAPKHYVYNIATGTGFSLREYAAAVSRRFPGAQISFGAGSATSSVNCILDVARAHEDFGFQANADVDGIVAGYVSVMERLGLKPTVS